MAPLCYHRHRFPPEIIQHAIWLYLRFTLSYRDVEDLLAERGLDISYETVRRWVLKFGPAIARRLRQRRPRPSDRWHLDEMVVRIAGKRTYLFSRPCRIDPVCESPRSMMFGSFTEGTVHLTGLTRLAFCFSPTVFAGRLPRHTLPPGFWSRGFHRASGTIRPSDYSQDAASHLACAYRVPSLGAARGS